MKLRWIAIALMFAAGVPAQSVWAAQAAGEKQFSLSGTGASDQDFDSTSFGTTGELGWFLTDQFELGIRQSVSALVLNDANDRWSGVTRGFAAYNFGQGYVVPYLGLNIGEIYGEEVHDTGAAGLETGLKFYVKDKTFIGFQVEYDFLFDDANDIDNQFNDGAFFYTVGIGFNF